MKYVTKHPVKGIEIFKTLKKHKDLCNGISGLATVKGKSKLHHIWLLKYFKNICINKHPNIKFWLNLVLRKNKEHFFQGNISNT